MTMTQKELLRGACPACPHPDHNLPLNWDSGGPQAYFKQFIELIGLPVLKTCL